MVLVGELITCTPGSAAERILTVYFSITGAAKTAVTENEVVILDLLAVASVSKSFP
jgi:hypothetical protein